jgi:2-isopropylmalate synthase
MQIQANKAIVGANAFAHESGIHQDGVLKHQETYEIINPELVGVPKSEIVLGKHSGRNALRTRLAALGYVEIVADKAAFEKIFDRFKATADAKKNGRIMDSDLMALVEDETGQVAQEAYRVNFVQVVSTTSTAPVHVPDGSEGDLQSAASMTSSPAPTATATVCLLDLTNLNLGDVASAPKLVDAATGRGPVHSIFKCINRLLKFQENTILVHYEVKSVTEGTDALGKVVVRICEGAVDESTDDSGATLAPEDARPLLKKTRIYYIGHGAHSDILTASAKAYISAVNR